MAGKVIVVFLTLSALLFGMEVVSSITGLTNCQGFVPNGNAAYILDRFSVIAVDITDPANPVLVDTLEFSTYVLSLAVYGNRGFLGVGSEVRILDLSDPLHPTNIGGVSVGSTSDQAKGVAYSNGYLYVAATNYFKIYQYNPPATLTSVYSASRAATTVSAMSNKCAVGGSLGVGATYTLYDVSAPSSPAPLGGASTPGFVVDIDLTLNRVYIADGASAGSSVGNVFLYLWGNPSAVAGTFHPDSGSCRHGQPHQLQYVVANGRQGFYLLNWTEPSSPILLDRYSLSAGNEATNVFVQYPYIFASIRSAVYILHSSFLADTGATEDITPPSVSRVYANGFTSWEDFRVGLVIVDDISGVNWSTVSLNITIRRGAGTTSFTVPYSDMTHSGDTLWWQPSTSWLACDTLVYSVSGVADMAGNISGTVTGVIIFDFAEPQIQFSFEPNETLLSLSNLSFRICDFCGTTGQGSGVNIISLNINLDGEHSITPDSTVPLFDGCFDVFLSLSGIPSGNHTLQVSISDNIGLGTPNVLNVSHPFYYDTLSADHTPPTVTPFPGDGFTGCTGQPVGFTVKDPSGVDWSTLEMTIDIRRGTGSTHIDYSPSDTQFAIIGDTMIMWTPVSPFLACDTIIYQLVNIADLAGNSGATGNGRLIVDLQAPVITEPETTITITIPAGQTLVEQFTLCDFCGDGNIGAGINTATINLNFPSGISHADSSVSDNCVRVHFTIPSVPLGANQLLVSACDNASCASNCMNGIPFVIVGSEKVESEPSKQGISLIAYPNPFNNTLEVSLSLPEAENGKLLIINASGRNVATIFEGKTQKLNLAWNTEKFPAGIYFIKWNGKTTLTRQVIFSP